MPLHRTTPWVIVLIRLMVIRSMGISLMGGGLIGGGLSGCAGSKDSILPAEGPSMKTLYERHFSDIGLRDTHNVRQELKSRPLKAHESDLAGYSRDAFNELDAHFPRLPNPTLVMYIFPHLVGEERLPVPGYATAFPMYRQVQYALPGEVPREAPPETSRETPPEAPCTAPREACGNVMPSRL